MMETTPRTRSSTRYRRAPTPKMSERKKKLFDDVVSNGDSPTQRNPYVRLERIIAEEGDIDSDIGPMSPLEFSSSPSSFNEVHRIMAREQKDSTKLRRTNFSNVLNEMSDDQSKTQSQRMTKRMNVPNSINDSTALKDSSEEDVVGPLCTSMKKLTSMTEQNYQQQMKTPSAGSVARGAAFRKSLVFDSGLTPHDDESNAPGVSKSSEHDSGERPKAKTSLIFTEPTISVRSFYGKPIEKTDEPKPKQVDDIIAKVNTHEIAVALAKRKVKSKSKPKTKSKSLAKRMKAPSLWRFSGKMKFNRHKLQRSQKDAKKKKLNASTSSDGGTETTIVLDVENVPPTTGAEFTSRIEQNLRLQKILKEQTNALNVSREINWVGSSKSTESPKQNRSGFLNSDGEDDDDSENESHVPQSLNTYEEIEVEVEEPTNRKFFKSSASNSAKKYRIMGRLSATLKRGGDLKFDPPPKRKKKRINKGEETVVLHNEITSIIDRLTSPSKGKPNTDADSDCDHYSDDITKVTKSNEIEQEALPESHNQQPDFIESMQTDMVSSTVETMVFATDVEKYRQMIPYNTTDPDRISQQESILELLISNGICDDETFKIFIAEPDLHKEKASQILDSLYCVDTMMPIEYENDSGPTEWLNSVESIPPMPGSDSIAIPALTNSSDSIETNLASPPNPPLNTNTIDQEASSSSNEATAKESDNATNEKLFPIFSKNFNAKDAKAPTFNALDKATKEWVPIGNQQYQLDVGQKEFGLRTCPQCEMQYSVHEPEDELLHAKYHNCVNILSFKGWNNERIVTQIPDWGLNGRVIYVCEADSKAKKERVKEILDMVDRDLGFAARTELKPKTLVYLAIAKQQIVGVCVVQPLEQAHRLKTENGVDCCTIETFPVKCGISRIWVSPQYRRHGIAAKLITSMRSHFLFGAFLTFDEIAFSSPTEDGKRFAASLAQRSDFLIYES